MKIYLKNFKCWTSKTIVMENSGIQLISGESGKGKSSILDAIYFCLYGNLQKIITHGQKSCEVKIEYYNGVEKVCIRRSRRPNRLTIELTEDSSEGSSRGRGVGGTIEDDIAQEFINDKFGHYFSQSSYIRQNVFENFIFMSPTEKLEFLEDSILKKFGVDSLKTRVQNTIRTLEQDIGSKSGQYTTYLEIYNSSVKPDMVEFPIKCHPKNRDIVIKNEHTKVNNFNILIKKLTQKIETAKQRMALTVSLRESLSKSSIKLQELLDRKEEYSSKLKDPSDIEKLPDLMEKLRKCELYEKYCKISQELDSEMEFYNSKLAEEISDARGGIKYIDSKKLHQLEEEIQTLKTTLKYFPRICQIRDELDGIKIVDSDVKHLELQLEDLVDKTREIQQGFELYKKTLICPCCQNRVIYKNSKLEKYSDTVDDQDCLKKIESGNLKIQELKNTIKLCTRRNQLVEELSTIEKKCILLDLTRLSDISSLSKRLEKLKEDYMSTLQIVAENKRLQDMLCNNNFPSLTRSTQIISKLKQALKTIPMVQDVNYNKKDLLEEIETVKLSVKLRNEYQTCLDSINCQIQSLEQEILTSNKKLQDLGIGDNFSLEKLERKMEEYRSQLSDASLNIDLISKWEKYNVDIANYNQIEKKVQTLNSELTDLRNELTLCQKFKSHILHAETLSIKNFINTLNSHVQIYLDKFFKNDQLLVKIETEKQLKKGGGGVSKSQITLNMEYKGYPIELSNLSGGEISRVNLAFVLAMSEIFKSPILMLDECMSTLDPDNCMNILQTVREIYKGKLVLMIHHQITEGLFDNVIEL